MVTPWTATIQASLSFYTSLWILERFLILWHKMSQTHLDFLCLLVLACRQWGFCPDCLGLCLPGFILVMLSPHRNSPFPVSVVAGPALVVLRIVRHVSATTIRELWNDKMYHSHVLEVNTPGWHSEVLGRERELMSKPGLGVLPFGGLECQVSRMSQVHILLVN